MFISSLKKEKNNMPVKYSNNYIFIFIILGVVFLLTLLLSLFVKRKKPGQAGEEETLQAIKNFLHSNNYKKEDYLLVNNLIIQKQNYWSCEIDILLLTRKWIYVIEVKDWQRGRLSGNLNNEHLEWSYKVGKQRRHRRHKMYSPFWQNETHIKRFKNYFRLASNQNILGIVVFSGYDLDVSLKENKKDIFENKHVWAKNAYYWLNIYEKQNTQLPFFEELKEKVSREITTPDKIKKHRVWAREVKEGKELRNMLR